MAVVRPNPSAKFYVSSALRRRPYPPPPPRLPSLFTALATAPPSFRSIPGTPLSFGAYDSALVLLESNVRGVHAETATLERELLELASRLTTEESALSLQLVARDERAYFTRIDRAGRGYAPPASYLLAGAPPPGASHGTDWTLESPILNIRTLEATRTVILKDVLRRSQAEITALEAMLTVPPQGEGGSTSISPLFANAADRLARFDASSASLAAADATLSTAIHRDEVGAINREDALVNTRGGLRAWAGASAEAIGRALAVPGGAAALRSGEGAAAPLGTAATLTTLAASSSAGVNSSVRSLRGARDLQRAALAAACDRATANIVCLEELAAIPRVRLESARERERQVRVGLTQATEFLNAQMRSEAEAVAGVLDLTGRLAKLCESSSAENARVESALAHCRARVLVELGSSLGPCAPPNGRASASAILASRDAALAAAEMSGRAGEAIRGAAALAAMRAANATALRAVKEDADRLMSSRSHARAAEAVTSWSQNAPRLEAALTAGCDVGARVVELAAHCASVELLLETEKNNLIASRADRDHALAVLERSAEARLVGGWVGGGGREGGTDTLSTDFLNESTELGVPASDILDSILLAAAAALPFVATELPDGSASTLGIPYGPYAPLAPAAASFALLDAIVTTLNVEQVRASRFVQSRPPVFSFFKRENKAHLGDNGEMHVMAPPPGTVQFPLSSPAQPFTPKNALAPAQFSPRMTMYSARSWKSPPRATANANDDDDDDGDGDGDNGGPVSPLSPPSPLAATGLRIIDFSRAAEVAASILSPTPSQRFHLAT